MSEGESGYSGILNIPIQFVRYIGIVRLRGREKKRVLLALKPELTALKGSIKTISGAYNKMNNWPFGYEMTTSQFEMVLSDCASVINSFTDMLWILRVDLPKKATEILSYPELAVNLRKIDNGTFYDTLFFFSTVTQNGKLAIERMPTFIGLYSSNVDDDALSKAMIDAYAPIINKVKTFKQIPESVLRSVSESAKTELENSIKRLQKEVSNINEMDEETQQSLIRQTPKWLKDGTASMMAGLKE